VYKNVTTEWAKTLPTGWKAVPLKRLLENGSMKVGPFGSQLSGNDFKNEGFWVYNQRAIVDENFSDNTVFIDASKYNSMRAFHVHAGDILVTTRGTIGRICQIPINYNEGIIHPCVIKFRLSGEEIPFSFLKHIFNESNIVKEQLLFLSNATTIDVIYSGTLKDIKIPVPPRNVRKKISAFLDFQCSEIDAISADIQKEIETLEQYKRSVITEAVTKGLNPDAEMKDSGAEWIGEVPTNWDLGRIGGFYSLRNEKVSDKDYPPLSVTMKGVLPQLETAAKTNDGDNRKLVRKGDFAINSRSDRRGSCGISKYDGSVSLINTVLTPRGKMSAAYYDWVFHCTRFSDEFYRQGHGIVDDLWTTGWQEMKKIIIPVPPLPEQNRIADYLSSKCSDVDFIISQKNQQVETLANYKKTLIYEYVTGKKEVPVQN
jgi:restriction modification system DNA specificity subunit